MSAGHDGLNEPGALRHTYPRRMRLSGSKQFEAVYAARVRKSLGPIAVCARANGLPHNRLGLSVPRRVGKAVRRNRVKRHLREAFRLTQHGLPTGLDLVVVVRPHAPLTLDDYAALLRRGVASVHKRCTTPGPGAPPDAAPPSSLPPR